MSKDLQFSALDCKSGTKIDTILTFTRSRFHFAFFFFFYLTQSRTLIAVRLYYIDLACLFRLTCAVDLFFFFFSFISCIEE